MITSKVGRLLPRTEVLFVLLAGFWGASFVSIEVGLHHFPPILFAALRYDVAGLAILGYAIASTDRWKPRSRADILSILAIGVFIIAGHHGFLYLGQQHVPGALASVIISLTPVLTAVFASAMLADEHITPLGILGFAFGVAGVAIVADPNPENFLSVGVVGIALVFLGGVSFALGSVLTQPLETELSLPALQGWAMIVGSGLLHVLSNARGESHTAIDWSFPAIASLVYLTIISGVVAFLLYFHLLDEIGPTELNLVAYLEPVVATVLTWALFGQLVATTTLVGFGAIFAGFALLKRDTLFAVVRSLSPTARQA
ncbi:DMT family transporter [Haladaptatus pallidirubidus]|uniref:DMT family transporter n=1 Tax=Haladaptatus pallidirubidus TaxID=1008152 RepID=A0AAV3UAW7_9EURY|nr:EamA family transporter [Haladaptatus pallidirubidus]